MQQSFKELTHCKVEDSQRPCGRANDVLMEYPSCRNRYLGVRLPLGSDSIEIWTPIEMVSGFNKSTCAVHLECRLSHDIVPKLTRLNEPCNDIDELRLHRVFQRRPEWTRFHWNGNGIKKWFTLRRSCRMVRLSSLIHWEAMTRDGKCGKIKDLLLDRDTLQTIGFKLETEAPRSHFHFLLTDDQPFLLDPKRQALYLDAE